MQGIWGAWKSGIYPSMSRKTTRDENTWFESGRRSVSSSIKIIGCHQKQEHPLPILKDNGEQGEPEKAKIAHRCFRANWGGEKWCPSWAVLREIHDWSYRLHFTEGSWAVPRGGKTLGPSSQSSKVTEPPWDTVQVFDGPLPASVWTPFPQQGGYWCDSDTSQMGPN